MVHSFSDPLDFQLQTNDDYGGQQKLINASASPPVSDLLLELQRNLSDDFNKKMEEWEKFRSVGRMMTNSKPDAKEGRKSAKPEKKPEKQRVKDLNWLEKELQKINREMQRLAKERQKFEKRAFRLQQLKDAMIGDQNNNKKEVLVRTSAGEFRFQGISDAFTKKLYEWETKQGVGPELSTIALLDESLRNKTPEISLPENDVPTTDQHSKLTVKPFPLDQLFTISVHSRARSVPNVSSKPCQNIQDLRCFKSAEVLTVPQLKPNNQCDDSKSKDVSTISIRETKDVPVKTLPSKTDDNYYSLLEENMFLLEQLKKKEDICGHLQEELESLDLRTEKTNRRHQDQLEKYRERLWEIHMSKPRDLQGSLRLISELKSRIEELQRCSDKLRDDREALEDSFHYHSEQQAKLADDLIHKMEELQKAGMAASGEQKKCREVMKCSPEGVVRIHELSTRLMQQARDVEQALAERTRHVCNLRWELLLRDVSVMLLQTELHRAKWQSGAAIGTSDLKRACFRQTRSWSSGEGTARKHREDIETESWLQDRVRRVSMAAYADWPKIEYGPTGLNTTVHELKKEVLKISSLGDFISDVEERKSEATVGSVESEIAESERYYDTGSANNSRSSSFSSDHSSRGLRSSCSDAKLYERTKISVRRNSSSNVSSLSGLDGSESSSVHEGDRLSYLLQLPWRSRDNVSTSSDSSFQEEENFTSISWIKGRPRSRTRGGRFSESLDEELWRRELQLRYMCLQEDEEPDENDFAASRTTVLDRTSEREIMSQSDSQNLMGENTNSDKSKLSISKANTSMDTFPASSHGDAVSELYFSREGASNSIDSDKTSLESSRNIRQNDSKKDDLSAHAIQEYELVENSNLNSSLQINVKDDSFISKNQKDNSSIPSLQKSKNFTWTSSEPPESIYLKETTKSVTSALKQNKYGYNFTNHSDVHNIKDFNFIKSLSSNTLSKESSLTNLHSNAVHRQRDLQLHKAKQDFLSKSEAVTFPAMTIGTLPSIDFKELKNTASAMAYPFDEDGEVGNFVSTGKNEETCSLQGTVKVNTSTLQCSLDDDPISNDSSTSNVFTFSAAQKSKTQQSTSALNTLCKQSLIVGLNKSVVESNNSEVSESKYEDCSQQCPPSSQSSRPKGTWLTKNIFKAK